MTATGSRIDDRLLLIGGTGGTNIGESLRRGAHALQIDATLLDMADAYRAPWVIARANWWLRQHRPTWLGTFSQRVVAECRQIKPSWLLGTGAAPVDRRALEAIAAMGVQTIAFLTDDPWNASSRSRWFLEALPAYTRVYSPRQANLDDLRRHGCRHVSYLPFGVDPDIFFPETVNDAEMAEYESDVFFAGGADQERVPFMTALLEAGLRLRLHGDYWHRYPETRASARGPAAAAVVRKSIRAAATCLCLVRRANRDGHSMRSFEVPAVGGCMLVEDTDEHRALFGPDGDAVAYFRSPSELVMVARTLLADPDRRRRLATRAHALVAGGANTYQQRLSTMLEFPDHLGASAPMSHAG
jgi:hypothetical protein